MISAAAACPSGLCLRSRLRLGSAISRQIEVVEPEQREKEQAANDAAFVTLLRTRSARGLPLPQLNQESWRPGCEGDRPSESRHESQQRPAIEVRGANQLPTPGTGLPAAWNRLPNSASALRNRLHGVASLAERGLADRSLARAGRVTRIDRTRAVGCGHQMVKWSRLHPNFDANSFSPRDARRLPERPSPRVLRCIWKPQTLDDQSRQ